MVRDCGPAPPKTSERGRRPAHLGTSRAEGAAAQLLRASCGAAGTPQLKAAAEHAKPSTRVAMRTILRTAEGGKISLSSRLGDRAERLDVPT